MRSIWTDVRQAVRAAIRGRGTSLAALVALAVGLAATTSVASLAYGVIFRPLPFPQPDALVAVGAIRTTSGDGRVPQRWSYAQLAALTSQTRSFAGLAGFTSAAQISLVGGEGPAEQVDAEIVSAPYFDTFGVPPLAGRTFTADEVRDGGRVLVVGADLWHQRFPGRAFAPGASLRVNGGTLAVIGLMPGGFRGVGGRAALWLPMGLAPVLTYADYLTTPQHFISLVGRLAPGVGLAQANAELTVLGPAVFRDEPPETPSARWSAAARPLAEARIDPAQARSTWLLVAAVAGVLLVTCLNVTTLLLMGTRVRARDIAVRVALGATRGRIVRLWLIETAVLVLAAGALAVMPSTWGIAWLRWLVDGGQGPTHTGFVQIGTFASPAFDGVTCVALVGLMAICTLATGLVPAVAASRLAATGVLGPSNRGTTRAVNRPLRALAAGEVAVAVVLVAGTLLLITTFARLQATQVGFDSDHVLTLWITPPPSTYPPEAGPAILDRLLTQIAQVPGVTSAALNRCVPFGSSCARTLLFRPGHTTVDGAAAVGRHYVSPRYFETLRIPLRAGRLLSDADRADRPGVAVINETAARRFWPNESPIGQHVWFGPGTGFDDAARPVEIVGVVGDVKYWPVDEPPGPDVYTSFHQFAYPDSVYLVRAAADPRLLLPSLRRAVAAVDPTLPIWDVNMLDAAVNGSLRSQRTTAAITGTFAGTAIGLAGLGVFVVMASAVASRRRELAVRMALGSSPAAVGRLILGEAATIAIGGVGGGLVAALLLLRFIKAWLFGVVPADPLTMTTAVGTMLGVALLAAWIPARAASRTSPIEALKQE